MRVGRIAFLLLIAFLGGAVPVSIAGATSITRTEFTGFSAIPNVGNVAQTAFRKGDQFGLNIAVYSPFVESPTLAADLSELGIPDPVVARADANGRASFGPFLVPENIADGPKTVFIKALDQNGDTATSTAQITVDSVPPSLQLSGAAFSTTFPAGGDLLTVSGSVDGTGSTAFPGPISIAIFDGQGNKHDEFSSTLYGLAFTKAVQSDGTFSVPLILFESPLYNSLENASLEVRVVVYDQAGNTTASRVRVPLAAADSCAGGTCASNVLFLPGIKASRLYGNESCGGTGEEKFWDPVVLRVGDVVLHTGDDKGRKLFLAESGESICSEIYTRPGDVLESVEVGPVTLNFYSSFIKEMNELADAGAMADWRAVAYDWRLSLTDLLANGKEENGKLFYGKATSTPHIEQTLRELAATSKTKKVTIVTHSNGGLVAKALLQKLGDADAARFVDKLVLVGVPQSGAPLAIGALLYGHQQDISPLGIQLLSPAVARGLALNAPMSYHLLPSANYLESVGADPAHPVARFDGAAYTSEIAAYGPSITQAQPLFDFLVAKEGGRTQPAPGHVGDAAIVNANLLAYGEAQHDLLDAWVPPPGIEVTQIAGWGNSSTVAGIEFYTLPPISPLSSSPVRAYRPIFTEDGDGVVPVPSALLMPEAPNIKRYWINLFAYNQSNEKREHATLLEISHLNLLIQNILLGAASDIPSFIHTNQPPPENSNQRLFFFLHSPLTLQVTDSSGNTTGLAVDGSVSENIPGSTYGEFGEVKYVMVPQGSEYTLTLQGLDSGTFSLDIQEESGGLVTTATIANVPTTAQTRATLSLTDLGAMSALAVDQNGDTEIDFTISPKAGGVVDYAALGEGVQEEVSAATVSGGAPSTASGGTTKQPGTQAATTSGPVAELVFSVETETPAPADLSATRQASDKPEQSSFEASTSDPQNKDTSPTFQTASVAGASSTQSFFSWLWNLLYTIFSAVWTFFAALFT